MSDLAPSPGPPAIPDHELLRPIGRGSYGEVWLARNTLNRYRAVKIVYRRSFSDRRPFDREWEGIKNFENISRTHEGLVDVLQVGRDPHEEYFYYVMELADDMESAQDIKPDSYRPKTLERVLKDHGRLGASASLKLGVALCDAVGELHRQGLVHRDLKPANIIFVNGVPKLADVGLVTGADGASSFVGTPGFTPKEGPGLPPADVYSLGIVLYEASTGEDRLNFPNWPAGLGQFPDQKELFELNEVMRRACQNAPGDRYASAVEMHADLLRLSRGRSLRRRRLMKLMVVLGLSGLAVFGVAESAAYRQRSAVLEARQRVVGASVAKGIRAMDSGDFLEAVPDFTEALGLEPGEPLRDRAQRLRLGSVLDECPKLTQAWFGRAPASDGQFSPDGARVVLARYYGEAELYDLKRGRLRTPLLKAPPTLLNAAYSPDGRLLVTVSQSSVACIWDAATLMEFRRLPHPSQLWGARFSPDGLRVVTAAGDGLARVWDLKTGRLALTLKQHTNLVCFADFSHDGQLIVTTSHDATAQLWNAGTGQPAGVPLRHDGWVTYAAFSPDDQKLVTASADRKARVWETATGRRLLPDLDHGEGVASAEFSPDGRFILTACEDGCARLWRADTGQPLAANAVLRHPGRLTRAGFSPDGHRMLTTGADGSARVWDLAGSAVTPAATAQVFSSDGTRFLTRSTNSFQVWDTASGQAVCGPLIPKPPMDRAELSRDGRFVLTFSALEPNGTNQWVQVWDVAAGGPLGPGLCFSNAPAGVALAGQGNRLVVFNGNHAQTWNTLTGSPLSPRVTFKEPVSQSFFSHDASRVATVSGHEVRVWDARNGRAVFVPLTHSQPVQAAQLSPDDVYLAVGCSDDLLTAAYAQVYHAGNGRPTGARLNHRAGVLSVAFSPDSRRLVTASADCTAVVWDCTSGRALAKPLKHENQVRGAAFSPDGQWIVTASADKTARVWDARSGEPLTPPLRGLTPLTRAGFLAGQTRVATVDDQGNTEVWKLSVEQRPVPVLRSLACLLSGGAAPGGGESLEALWQRLRTQYPADFVTTPEEIAAWHEAQAQDSELQGQWFAVAFHLEHLRSLRPGDLSVTQRLARAREQLRKKD